jgi:PAS domain S-box-containing protein
MYDLITRRKLTQHHAASGRSAWQIEHEHILAELKVQSLRFNAVIDNIPQGLCFYDPAQRIVFSNRRYAEIYGLSPNQIHTGMVLRQILALRAAVGSISNMTTDEYIALTQAQPNALTPNGTIVHLKNGRIVSIRHQPTPDGGYVSTHEDITERWIAEAAVRHGEKLRAVGQMAGGIAHDLNNLLTVVGCGIEEVLTLPGDCGGARTELETVMRSVDSAADLLRRMLDFSRSQPPLLEPTDLNTWLIPLRDIAARALGARYRMELRSDPALQACPVDRSQLESALLNLILNARDSMPKGGVITVETECVQIAGDAGADPTGLRAGRYFAITVHDNGPGMPPEVAARAFEPFFSTKPVGQGTGLGLSMVQQFARDAGGSVSLRTEPGAGTSVRIVLPRN